jgi:hypothetical protein
MLFLIVAATLLQHQPSGRFRRSQIGGPVAAIRRGGAMRRSTEPIRRRTLLTVAI